MMPIFVTVKYTLYGAGTAGVPAHRRERRQPFGHTLALRGHSRLTMATPTIAIPTMATLMVPSRGGAPPFYPPYHPPYYPLHTLLTAGQTLGPVAGTRHAALHAALHAHTPRAPALTTYSYPTPYHGHTYHGHTHHGHTYHGHTHHGHTYHGHKNHGHTYHGCTQYNPLARTFR